MNQKEKIGWNGGYAANWLGSNIVVNKPWAGPLIKSNVLKSQHPSYLNGYFRKCRIEIMMNQRRRFAYVVLTNICDLRKNSGLKSNFHFDDVIPVEQQHGNAIYVHSPVSRSHAARRYQMLYGKTEFAALACEQSYSYAQLLPQSETLHMDLWGPLEQMAEKQIKNAHVFIIIVFDDDKDPEFRGVQLPWRYVKIFSYLKEEGGKYKHQSMAFYAEDDFDFIGGCKRSAKPKLFQMPMKGVEVLSGVAIPDNVIETCNYDRGGVSNLNRSRRGKEITSLSQVIF